jgi:hypothetical protein
LFEERRDILPDLCWVRVVVVGLQGAYDLRECPLAVTQLNDFLSRALQTQSALGKEQHFVFSVAVAPTTAGGEAGLSGIGGK